jgi:hypothetical protein
MCINEWEALTATVSPKDGDYNVNEFTMLINLEFYDPWPVVSYTIRTHIIHDMFAFVLSVHEVYNKRINRQKKPHNFRIRVNKVLIHIHCSIHSLRSFNIWRSRYSKLYKFKFK